MRATVAGVAERGPRRSPVQFREYSSHRGEVWAGVAAAALLAQLLFGQLILITGLLLAAAGKLLRWRPRWLAVPAATGAAWLLDTGPRGALAGLKSGAAHMAGFLATAAAHPARLTRPDAALAGASRWLPAQLPLALLAGSAEAAALLWLSRYRMPADWRPGLIAMLRRRVTARAIRAGQVTTRSGFAVGLHSSTGALAGLSWAEAAGGALVTGSDPQALASVTLTAVCAALRRRKTVLVLDLTAGGELPQGLRRAPRGALTAAVTGLADRLGIPVTEPEVWLAADIGAAIRSRGVVLMRASAAWPASLLLDELTGVLARLRDLELRADCLAVIAGCETVAPGPLTAALRLGPATGTGLLLTTVGPAAAAGLWPDVSAAVLCGPVSEDLALVLAARVGPGGPAASQQAVTSLTRQQPGVVALLVRPGQPDAARPRLTGGISPVPIDLALVR
jgi:hypothetical protein